MIALSNIRIGIRLGISFFILLLLLVVIAVVALLRMEQQSESSRNFVTRDVSRVMLASTINIHAQSAALKLLQILPNKERDVRIKLYKEMDDQNKLLDEVIAEIGQNYGDMEPSLLAEIKQHRKVYNEAFFETVDLVEADIDLAIKQFNQDTGPALELLLSAISQLLVSEQNRMFDEQKMSEVDNQQAQNIVILLAIVAFVLGGGMAILVSRSISLPLKGAVEFSRKISLGDLRPQEFSQRKDEIGELMSTLSQMRNELFSLISSINESSEHIQFSAESLEEPVKSINTGSHQQVESVTSIIDALTLFSQQATHSASTAQEAQLQSENARNLAVEGKQRIEQATQEFASISATISHSASAVDALRERAKSVRDLIKTISEIADQTNLLALNAAIEAARAGESGRGFSVVADEVRGLAGRTGQATIEINDVIDAIDRETLVAVERISEGKSEMERGVDMLQQMVDPLTNLSAGAQTSLEGLNILEEAVAEQANESARIEQKVKQIGDKALENESAVDIVTSTTHKLSGMSESLANQVRKFLLS